MFNEVANKEYEDAHHQIQVEIDKLQDLLAKHNEQALNIHWGHVGDLNGILNHLKQINGEEE
jgi:hypothetical protein